MKILGEVVEQAAALVGGRGRHGGGTAGAAAWAATGMGDDDRRRPRRPTMTSRSNPHFAEALDVGEGGFVDASQRKSETVDRVADARDRDAVLSLDNIASMD
jgi:hypothetical protein